MSEVGDSAKKGGRIEAIAAVVEDTPFVGKPLATFLRAPGWLQRTLVWLVLVFAVYPVLAFVIAMYLVHLMPDGPRHWVQGKANSALEIATRATERDDINNTNHVIDGVSLLQFTVSPDNWGTESYIERITANQLVSFSSYQNSQNYSRPGQDTLSTTCELQDLETAVGGGTVGTLNISFLGLNYTMSAPVEFSHRQLTYFFGLDKAHWDQLTAKAAQVEPDGKLPAVIDMLVSFKPDDALGTASNPKSSCSQYGVFVVMTYSKPQVP